MTQIKTRAVACWCMQILAAAILLQTLLFKFTGAEESRYIFSTLGLEPWGRCFTGLVELLAATLLLIPRTAAFGALLALGVISGAIVGHLTKLGIAVRDDHGLLFGLAIVVFISAASIVAFRRDQLMPVARRVRGRTAIAAIK